MDVLSARELDERGEQRWCDFWLAQAGRTLRPGLCIAVRRSIWSAHLVLSNAERVNARRFTEWKGRTRHSRRGGPLLYSAIHLLTALTTPAAASETRFFFCSSSTTDNQA